MKKKLLLVDDSITVQKVVSLTLDKAQFEIINARNRGESMRAVSENKPDLILLSDQVNDISASTFPKEVEVWLGPSSKLPAFVLITGEAISQMKNYSAVLKKPFSPQQLQNTVKEWTSGEPAEELAKADHLEEAFNNQFNDESDLVEETLEGGHMEASLAEEGVTPSAGSKKQAPSLWGKGAVVETTETPVLDAKESMAYKAVLEGKVEEKLEEDELVPIVSRLLDRMMPPIIEKLVQERLDKLLREHEQFMELNET